MPSEAGTYIDLEAGRLYYEAAGRGEPLVLLHAGFVDSRIWDAQWAALTRGNRVIRFDLLGFGKSARPAQPHNRRDELYRLLQQLGIARAALLGCSLGGEIALDFTLEHPEMVSALVLVSSVPGGFEMRGAPPQPLLELLAALQQGDWTRASELQMQLWIDGPQRQPGQADADLRRRAAEMSQIPLANQTWFQQDPTPLDPPAAQRLAEVRIPALILAGQLDDGELLRAADVLASGIPGARQATLPNCAHLPNMEQPELFNTLVTDFLSNLPVDHHP